VQQSYLCGKDLTTNIDYSHRREWIASLLKYQASVFAIDIGNYSILSNHQHLIARTRPDIAKTWSDEEVAWRWKLAWPTWINGQWIRHPTDEEVEKLLANPRKILQARANLADLSWLMARWKEPIAKLANAESGKKGHFYDQRFGSREIADDGGLLCNNVYVDLNQMKANMAQQLEDCLYSGIHDRMVAWREREAVASHKKFHEESTDDYLLEVGDVNRLLADCFLSPIGQGGPLILVNSMGEALTPTINISIVDAPEAEAAPDPAIFDDGFEEEVASELTEPEAPSSLGTAEISGETSPDASSRPAPPSEPAVKQATWRIHKRLRRSRRRRASDHVMLDMPFEQYLGIVQASVAQIGADAARPPPEEISSTLHQFGIEPTSWFAALENFETWFHRAVGSAENLAAMVAQKGKKWFQGIRACRTVFG